MSYATSFSLSLKLLLLLMNISFFFLIIYIQLVIQSVATLIALLKILAAKVRVRYAQYALG